MQDWIRKIHVRTKKIILRRLLAKPVPERYTTSLPVEQQKGYDFISVHGQTKEHDDCLLRSIDDRSDRVSYFWWDREAGGTTAQNADCAYADVVWGSLSVEHRYITWEFRYRSLTEAFWHDLLRIPKVKWIFQRYRERFLKPIRPNLKMSLLERIVEEHSAGSSITIDFLLIAIHGGGVRLSSDNYRHRSNLVFLLAALQESGDVLVKDRNNQNEFIGHGDVKPTPHAISTLAEYSLEKRRHQDVVRLTRYQLFLGWAMFAVAAATLIVQFFEGT